MAVSSTSSGSLKTGVCLSTDRPDNPYNGQVIYETDTNRTLIYDNSAWVVVADPALLSFSGSAASVTGNLTGNVTGDLTGNVAASAVTIGGENVTPYTGRRNLVYNGAMEVAQRGTSETGITTGASYYTADRYRTIVTNAGTWTQTVEADGPTGSGFSSSLKMNCTTALASLSSNERVIIQYGIEGQDVQCLKKGTSNAESLTLSFWIKSNVTGTYVIELYDEDNDRAISSSYVVLSSGTWEKKTITFVGDTSGVLDNDVGRSLSANIYLAAGPTYSSGVLQSDWTGSITQANRAVGQVNLASAVNNYWQITGFQLELGNKATPFEHRPYGEELERCKRYYKRYAANGNAGYRPWAGGIVNAATQHLLTVFHSPYMRAAPAFNFSQIADFDIEPFDAQPSALSIYSSGSNTGEYTNILMTSSASYTPGHYVVLSGDTAGSWIEFDAEL